MQVGDWVRVIHHTNYGHYNRVGQVTSMRGGIVYVRFNDGEFPFTQEDLEPE